MNRTSIEYLDFTWNPLAMRCTPISAGCKNCWHLRMCDRLVNVPGIRFNEEMSYKGINKPYLVTERLDAPLKRKKPSIIGVQFMGDIAHPDIKAKDRFTIWNILSSAHTAHHTFIVLTKRPAILKNSLFAWSNMIYPSRPVHDVMKSFFSNCWLGVSVSTQEDADKLIAILLQIPAAVRFVSVEPMLEEISLDCFFDPSGYTCGTEMPCGHIECEKLTSLVGLGSIAWTVIGCESGPKRRPCKTEWIERLVEQCADTDVPVFVKQAEVNGKVVSMPKTNGRVWDQYPE